MHLKRWITGLSALPFLIFLVYKGGAFFTSLVSVAGLVALWECYRMVLGVITSYSIHYTKLYETPFSVEWGRRWSAVFAANHSISLSLSETGGGAPVGDGR